MTEDEKRINNIDSRVSTLETTFKMFMQEMRDFKTEMRQQNQLRAEELREMRQKHDADMREIRTSIDGMGKHVRNLSVATIIGVGTIAITVVYSILTR